ncbi:hypothetical protein NQ176_g6261 [Zarea fungicola]|uniref:Uncharacterized protein n=1 Tax=Zarea fungicola TaxID=93591 RepID=A0ACC1N4N6_9HYPO|nr:hypothetical protein NQ176_g6261 [Lecanicillium fungicola]
METLSQMATSAAKLAFGDKNNTEPVSGVQGDVSRGQPYDAGNLGTQIPFNCVASVKLWPTNLQAIDPVEQEQVSENLSGKEYHDVDSSDAAYTTGSRTTGVAITSSDKTSSVPGQFPSGQDVTKSLNTGNITTATNETSDSGFTHQRQHGINAPESKPSEQDLTGGVVTTSTNHTTDSGFTSPGDDMRGARNTSNQVFDNDNNNNNNNDNYNYKNNGGNDNSGNNQKEVEQVARSTSDKDQDAPSGDSFNHSSPSKVPSTDNDNATNNKLSGPGPRDVAVIARENGGDAGNVGNRRSDTASASSGDINKDINNAGSNEGSDEKGTGEQYVKSSGLHADGGDFDATKPGAGREADRLLEQKGISTTTSGGSGHSGSGSGDNDIKSQSSGGKEKHGIVDKIKEKLHKH